MASLSLQNLLLLVQFALFLLIPNSSHGHLTQSKNQVALFIFGDSVFDVGNNNYINTTTQFQANYWPYGETFFKHPTGRFSDGRLIPDFIAGYAKLPLLPPYKQPGNHQFTNGFVVAECAELPLLPPYELPGNHQFTNGVNFASAGAGALDQTHQGMVIDLNTQLIYFKKVEKSLMQQLGDKEAQKLLSRAVYLFSFGSNDYVAPFTANSNIFQVYSQEEYVKMVVGNLTYVIKEIYESGGRKFGFVSLGPLGCMPFVKAFNPANTGDCMKGITDLVKLHNIALSRALQKLEEQLQGFKYSNFDFNATAIERMDNPSKYGLKEGESACCGSGPYKGENSCGGKRGMEEYQLCSNASEYVFFDAAHPTEIAYQQLAKLMWSGTPDVVSPYNLKALFEQDQ